MRRCSFAAVSTMRLLLVLLLGVLRATVVHSVTFNVPSSPPSSAATVDPSLLSVSIEFFAFPGYTQLVGTANCLQNLADLRGAQPAIRIGGTTQYVLDSNVLE